MRLDIDIKAMISLEVPKGITTEEVTEIIETALTSIRFKPILKKAEIVDTNLQYVSPWDEV